MGDILSCGQVMIYLPYFFIVNLMVYLCVRGRVFLFSFKIKASSCVQIISTAEKVAI